MKLVVASIVVSVAAILWATLFSHDEQEAWLSEGSGQGEFLVGNSGSHSHDLILADSRESLAWERDLVLPPAHYSPGPTSSSTLEGNTHMDPNDPSSWPATPESSIKSSGARMDALDPSSWIDPSHPAQARSVGSAIDPHDPMAWPDTPAKEKKSIGPRLDPFDPNQWPTQPTPLSFGERLDPSDPATWD